MKIIIARTAGFCWGVKRAMDKVLELRDNTEDSISTFGPLIHNPQILNKLDNLGIKASEDIDQLDSNYVVIRTHGIPPSERNQIKGLNCNIIDTTCPDVAKIHSRIKRSVRSGQDVIIAGHAGHPEIKGIMGYAGEKGHLIESLEDVAKLPEMENVGLVAQSTFNKGIFRKISEAVKARFPKAEIYNTICDATHNRQVEAKELSTKVDLMIVIGGKTSSNTKRLAEVSKEKGVETYHIETEAELDPSVFKGKETIGITAGASTPDWIITDVVNYIKSKAGKTEVLAN
jgi:(E)-4-hydroxy-3-methyl-but-2-enyl pyrophosphate reductase